MPGFKLDPRWILGGIGLLALVLIICLKVGEYGGAKEEHGVQKERAAWQKADEVMEQHLEEASNEATHNAAIRELEHAEFVEQEREKIDAAEAENRSAFDELFGN